MSSDEIIIIDDEVEVEEIALSSGNDSDCQIADFVINSDIVFEKSIYKNNFNPNNNQRKRVHTLPRNGIRSKRGNERKKKSNGIKLEQNNNSNKDNASVAQNVIEINSETVKTEVKTEPKNCAQISTENMALTQTSTEIIPSIQNMTETMASIQTIALSQIWTQTSTDTMTLQNSLIDNSSVDLQTTQLSNIPKHDNITIYSPNKSVNNDICVRDENLNEMEVINNESVSDNCFNYNFNESPQMECKTQVLSSNLENLNLQPITVEVMISQKSDACIQTNPIESPVAHINPKGRPGRPPKNSKTNGLNLTDVIDNDMTEVENEVNENEIYKCSWNSCGQTFLSALLHYKHEKKHFRESEKNGIKLFKCQKCIFSAFTLIDLIFHNSEHKGLYLCRFANCLYRCDTNDKLNIHIEKHDKQKCSDCHKLSKCNCGEKCCSQ